MPLTPRRQRFVDEYLIDLDARHAAIRAGYSPRSKNTPHKLLRQPEIAAAIGAAMMARAARTGITRERVLAEYKSIAFADLALLADWGPDRGAIFDAAMLDPEDTAAIALIAEVDDERSDESGAAPLRLRIFDKLKALEALALLLEQDFDAGIAPPPRHGRPH